MSVVWFFGLLVCIEWFVSLVLILVWFVICVWFLFDFGYYWLVAVVFGFRLIFYWFIGCYLKLELVNSIVALRLLFLYLLLVLRWVYVLIYTCYGLVFTFTFGFLTDVLLLVFGCLIDFCVTFGLYIFGILFWFNNGSCVAWVCFGLLCGVGYCRFDCLISFIVVWRLKCFFFAEFVLNVVLFDDAFGFIVVYAWVLLGWMFSLFT